MGIGRVLGRVGLAIFCLVLVLPLESVEATNGVTLSASLATVASGSTVDLTASMPVVSAGSTTQTLTQTIDPTKVKLTSASDITYPAGWTLSYSTDGTIFSSTAPTTTNGWAAVTAVRATGSLESSGASNGFQVASRTATGSAVNTAPASLAVTNSGDGYQAFFDPSRTRVFNLFHHSAGDGITAPLDCYVISTGQRCVGFPFNYGGNTDEAANGVVIGSTIWAAGRSGFYCIDISAVLANTANSPGGGSPAKCFSSGTSALVPGTSGKPLVWFAGASPLGSSNETKLFALDDSAQPRALLYCIDTAVRALCSAPSVDTGILGSTYAGLSEGTNFSVSNTLLVENRLYVMVGSRTSSNQATSSNTVNCLVLETWQRCPGWTGNYSAPVGLGSAGKFADIPNAQGTSRGVCLLVPTAATTAGWPCWNALGQMFTPSSVNLPFIDFGAFHAYGSPVRIGTRLFVGNANYQGSYQAADPSSGGQILCYDASLNDGTGGRCNSAASNLGPTASNNTTLFQNYTVTPDPQIPDCLWITRHSRPIIRAINIKTGVEGCSSIAPTTASFSGTSIVPRMGCEASSQPIRQWESFRLTSAGTGTFAAAKLTVKNSSGVAISGWTDVSLTLNTDLNLATLSPTDTGSNPTFDVAFEGITGSITTASAQVRVVGDAPQLCTKVTAVYSCPTGVGPISSLANSVASVSATGSSVLGGVTTTLTPASQTVTVTAPAISTCTSSITGRAGDAGGGASGSAIPGVTVSLLDSSGNPITVNGTPVTTTTASDGTYSFANVLPASYKVSFSTPSGKTLVSSTTVSGASGTTAGAATSLGCPGGGTVTTLQTNMKSVASATLLTRTGPSNLIQNGDFTTAGGSGNLYYLFGTQGSDKSINGITAPVGTVSNWTVSGGGSATYAFWQRNAPGPPIGVVTSTSDGNNSSLVYFGNEVGATVTPTPTYNSDGWTSSTYSLTTRGAAYGANNAPPTLSQTFPTVVGTTYRLQFLQAYENYGSIAGIAALDITGFNRSYFKVPKSVTRYTVEFVASSSTTTIAFLSWGHLTAATELALDDVMVNACTPATTDLVSPLAATIAGTNAVVNALYTIPAAATADIPPAGTQGTAQSINVLTNDTAASGATLTANSVRLCGTSPVQSPPSCSQTSLTTADGTYSVNASTGVVTFTPTSSFAGTATVIPTYQVSDSASNVVSSTITVTVIARPTLSPDTSSGAWDTDQMISPLTNDVADSRTTLVASSVKLCGPSDTSPNCTATSLTNSDGTYTVNSDGTVTFNPVASFTGTSTNPVTYSVIDSLSQKSASTITPSVTPPGAPVANPKTKTVSPSLAASFATITGQSGLATGAQLTPARTFLCSLSPAQSPPNCNATSVTTTDGTWVLNQITGVVTYQPASGVSAGTKVAIRYQVTDAAGQSASALLTPVIPPAPIAKPDASSGQQGTAQIISLTGNDVTGSASSSLDVSTVKFCAGNQVSPNCTATSLTVTGQGTYTIDSFGIVTFIPVSGFTGTATPINYQVSDSVGQVTSSTLSISVIPPPAPIATRDTGSAAYGESVIFEPWKNDSGGSKPDGASQPAPDVVPTSIRLCSASQVAPNCTATSVGTVDGTYTLDTATGKVTFAPVSGFSGTATAPVTYQISNNWTGPSGVATTTAILIPTIAAPGDPLATNDQSSTRPLIPVVLKPVMNDAPGLFALNATSLRLCEATDIAPNCSRLSITNDHGTYVVDQNTGYVTFTPAKGFNGLASVPYVISDMNARFSHANLFISVSQDLLVKTGTSGIYELVAIGILTYLTGTGLVSANKWKRRKSEN